MTRRHILWLVLIACAASAGAQESGPTLSIEPYAITRKGEPEFEALVDRALASLFASGEIRQLYAKWFATTELTLPMNPLLSEAFATPNTYPASP